LGSGLRHRTALFAFITCSTWATSAWAATRTWVGLDVDDDNWSSTANWSGSTVPVAGDAVVFDSNTAENCDIDTAVATLASITITTYTGSIREIDSTPRSINTTGAVSVGCSTCTFTMPKGMAVGGLLTVSGGTFNAGSGALAARGGITISGGTFNASTSSITVSGVFTYSSGTFDAGTGTINLRSGANRTHPFGGAIFYDVVTADPAGPGTTGLVGYWKLDEAAGTTAADSSGSGITLNWQATPAIGGGTGAPLLFTNSHYYNFDIADFLEYDSGSAGGLASTVLEPSGKNWTLSAWYAPEAMDDNGTDIVTAGDDFFIRVNATGTNLGTPNVTMRRSTSGWETCTAQNLIKTNDGTNAWHHLAATNDGSNLSIWLDGVKTTCAYSGFTQSYTGRYFRIGRNGNTSMSYDVDGSIDDVRVYSRALSDDEVRVLFAGGGTAVGSIVHTASQALTVENDLTIRSNNTVTLQDNLTVGGILTVNGTLNPAASKVLYAGSVTMGGSGSFTPSGAAGTMIYGNTSSVTLNQTSFNTVRFESMSEPNLVGYWKLDEGSGSLTYDWSGQGNNGVLKSGATWQTTPSSLTGYKVSFNDTAAGSFDGVNDNIEFSSTFHNPVTFAAWIYRTGDGSTTFPRVVTVPSARLYLTTVSSGSTGGVGFLQDCSSGSDGNWQANGSPYTYNAWHHIAATYDGSSTGNTPAIYIDGVAVTVSVSAAASQVCLTGSGTSYIGAGVNNPPAAIANFFQGYIDDVRIYDAALTAAQIKNLYNGGYSGRATVPTWTLSAATTANAGFHVDHGTVDTSTHTLTAANTDATQVASVTTGTLKLGSSTSTAFKGGLTINGAGTLSMNTNNATAQIGASKVLTMNGTLDASTSGLTRSIKSVSGNYTFSIGSTTTATPTLNINGLQVQNTDVNGMYINSTGASGPVTTITRFDNVAFSSGSSTMGATLLNIYATTLYLSCNACTFNRNGMASGASGSFNVKIAGDNSSANGETRAVFGNTTCKDTSGATETCEPSDSDNDTGDDGVADSTGGGVAQFVKQAYFESAGTIAGFPTASFSWTNFAYWRSYSAFNNDDGAGNNKVYARDDTNSSSVAYTYTIDTTTYGTIVGAPRWDMESSTHCVYFLTTKGYVFKLTDDGSTLALASGYPYRHTTGGTSATGTSSLVMDATSLYWAGKDGAGARKMFRVTRSSGALNGTPRAISADINGGLAIAAVSSTNYLFGASDLITTSAKVYKMSTDLATEFGSMAGTQATTSISGRLSIWNGKIYFAEDKGKIWAIDTTDSLATQWSYQDTGNGHGACSASSDCTVKALYLDPKPGKVYFGDQDGHVYVVASGAVYYSGFPWRPTGGSTTDPFVTAPVYVTGLGGANAGVIAIGSSTGKVFFIDQKNLAMTPAPALIRMYHVGSAVSAIAYRATNSSSGTFLVSTANGKTFYIDSADVADPTPTSN
jgi:hypothetical protein